MKIIDTFPEFDQIWQNIINTDVQSQLEAWQGFYSLNYPELLNKIVKDYEDENVEWRNIALNKIFPLINKEFNQIRLSHKNLMNVIHRITPGINELVHFDPEPTFVIYVGIGTGAGWATEYEGDRAMLFGLENIAELGWSGEHALEGLVSHETGHLYHFLLREEKGMQEGKGPTWDLYEEGLAEYFESLIRGKSDWHQSIGQPGWYEWCSRNIGRLAGTFLDDMRSGRGTKKFFGSWYDLDGWKETGYFLGGTVIKMLNLPIEDAALLTEEEVKNKFTAILEELSGKQM